MLDSFEKQNIKEMNKKISELNNEQKKAFKLMVENKNVFITGAGGCGKTFLIKLFTQLYNKSRVIAVTSTTGTSALLINGTTIHSYLGIGYGHDSVERLVEKINNSSWLKNKWKKLDCLIIDEISMLSPDIFDKLEEVAKIVRKSTQDFGGIQLILSGDFLQLPVVNIDKFCFEAKSWNKCIANTVYLKTIIRQNDEIFQNVLNNIRIGIVNKDIIKILKKRIKKKLDNEFNIQPTKLFSKNVDVNRINDIELDKLAENNVEFLEYNMDIYVYGGVSDRNSAIKKFKKFCTSPDTIQLCIGAQVMLLKNLDLSIGLANGSRGVVTDFIDNLPLVKFLNGEEKIINMHTWDIEDNNKPILRARQLPLKVAYAISIHSCQGCTLDLMEVDLSDIFEYGQAYVALSRVKSLEGLSISSINFDNICAHPTALEYYENLS